MALAIEDGSLVAGANSYVDVDGARAFAEARALTFPDDDAEGNAQVEAAAIAAMDYLEKFRDRYQGTKINGEQSLQFPRYNVYLDGFLVSSSSIPAILVAAQCQLIVEAVNGLDLQPTGNGQPVKKRKVDVIETEFFSNSGAPQPVLVKVRGMLAPLFKASGGLTVERA